MGHIGRVLSFGRRIINGVQRGQVKLDVGGASIITGAHLSDAGDDSQPLPGDYLVTVGVQSTGREVVVGYTDPKNLAVAGPGEKRLYSRSLAGITKAWLHLFADGSARIENTLGVIELKADGSASINGATISVTGAITSPVSISAPSIIANGKELALHVHAAGNPPGNTGPNI